jgi:chromosome partitioning protein
MQALLLILILYWCQNSFIIVLNQYLTEIRIMIILIGSQKGGCGKSTIAVNVACSLALDANADVLLVDADPQGSVSRWVQDRQSHPELKNIPCVQISGDIRITLRDLAERYKYLVVDVAGRDSVELRSGLSVADLLLSPLRPSQYDLDTVPHLSEVYSMAKDFNQNLKGYLVLNLCPTNPVIKEADEAREYLKDFSEFALAETLIFDRKAYRDSIAEGQTALEWKDEKAAESIRLLIKEVFNA